MGESAFDRALAKLLGVEGGFANRRADRGGRTNYGITERVARANGYTGRMEDLSAEWARRIYRAQYWDLLRLDQVALASERIAGELFDTGVNMGTGVAATFLQRALNFFNGAGRLYSDIGVDGTIGPLTLYALREYLDERGSAGETVMLRALNSLQGERYIAIGEGDPYRDDPERSQEQNAFGWFLQRVS